MNKNRSRYSGWYKDLNFEKMTVTNDIYDFRIDNNVIYQDDDNDLVLELNNEVKIFVFMNNVDDKVFTDQLFHYYDKVYDVNCILDKNSNCNDNSNRNTNHIIINN